TCETRMRETRGSAGSGETGRRRTNALLGHLGRKCAKGAVREFRPKMEQLARFDFGTLGT
ncbi:hypothetical protein KI387_033040, partial [Taxus chinensis]